MRETVSMRRSRGARSTVNPAFGVACRVNEWPEIVADHHGMARGEGNSASPPAPPARRGPRRQRVLDVLALGHEPELSSSAWSATSRNDPKFRDKALLRAVLKPDQVAD
jgi:hypothetical protein